MESEVELHTTLTELRALATVPDLYPRLVELGSVPSLLELLAHENTDIAIAVVNLLQELTDPDTLNESQEGSESLVDALMAGQACALLVQNLDRLDETVTEEAEGIHNTLCKWLPLRWVFRWTLFSAAIFENITEVRAEVCSDAASQGMLSWILKRLRAKMPFHANKLYASEMLSILLQSNNTNRQLLGELDGIDILLQQLAVCFLSFANLTLFVNTFLQYYKRHDPASSEELEMMENLFNCLCSSLMLTVNRDKFLKGEGLQLMNLMLRLVIHFPSRPIYLEKCILGKRSSPEMDHWKCLTMPCLGLMGKTTVINLSTFWDFAPFFPSSWKLLQEAKREPFLRKSTKVKQILPSAQHSWI